ncbi:HAMP domain-containing protein [Sphingobium scionense]
MLFLVVEKIVETDGRMMLGREVDTDLAGLADIYVSSGETELRARIADRLAMERGDSEKAYYLLADAGRRVAGNIDHWPALASEVSEARLIRLPGGTRVFARATLLGPDTRLIVGRSNHRAQALQTRLAIAFAIAGAIVALLSLAAGHFAARRLRRRVERINHVFDAVRAGDIAVRARATGASDELAELAANTNAMLDQVQWLMEAQRSVSDQTAHEIRTPLMHLDTRILKAMERTGDEGLLRTLGRSRDEIRSVVRLLDPCSTLPARRRCAAIAGVWPMSILVRSPTIWRTCMAPARRNWALPSTRWWRRAYPSGPIRCRSPGSCPTCSTMRSNMCRAGVACCSAWRPAH